MTIPLRSLILQRITEGAAEDEILALSRQDPYLTLYWEPAAEELGGQNSPKHHAYLRWRDIVRPLIREWNRQDLDTQLAAMRAARARKPDPMICPLCGGPTSISGQPCGECE